MRQLNTSVPFPGIDLGGALNLGHPLCNQVWAWWPFIDGAGVRVSEAAQVSAVDRSGSFIAGGTASKKWNGLNSQSSGLSAAEFNPGGDYISLSNSGAWGSETAQTFAMWTRPTAYGSAGSPSAPLNAGTSGNQFRIYNHSDGNVYIGVSGQEYVVGQTTLWPSLETWVHLIVVLGGPTNGTYVYRNGLPLGGANSAFSSQTWSDTSLARIGFSVPQNNTWTGQLADYWRWTRYLVSSEAYEFYQQSLRGYPDMLLCGTAPTWAVGVSAPAGRLARAASLDGLGGAGQQAFNPSMTGV